MAVELDKNLDANRDKRRHRLNAVWRLISSFGYVFGGLFLLLVLYAYLYYKTNFIGQIGLAFNPYQNYAIPVLIAGIVLLIVGYVTELQIREKIKDAGKQQNLVSIIGACPNCGANRDS